MLDCPKCNASVDGVTCHKCGFSEVARSNGRAPVDPSHFLCDDVFQGLRCTSPGPFSSSTQGGGPWYCHAHYPPFRNWHRDRAIPPPQGFLALASLTKRSAPIEPHDYEGDLERMALQAEDATQ